MRLPNADWLAIFGMTADEYERFRNEHGAKPFLQFRNQVKQAKIRGVPWGMTFPQWWKIWQESGKYHLRGVRKGQFCMQRPMDRGGYTPDNVEILEVKENGHTRACVNALREVRSAYRGAQLVSYYRQDYCYGGDPLKILMDEEEESDLRF